MQNSCFLLEKKKLLQAWNEIWWFRFELLCTLLFKRILRNFLQGGNRLGREDNQWGWRVRNKYMAESQDIIATTFNVPTSSKPVPAETWNQTYNILGEKIVRDDSPSIINGRFWFSIFPNTEFPTCFCLPPKITVPSFLLFFVFFCFPPWNGIIPYIVPFLSSKSTLLQFFLSSFLGNNWYKFW